jgi:hypothetical protein
LTSAGPRPRERHTRASAPPHWGHWRFDVSTHLRRTRVDLALHLPRQCDHERGLQLQPRESPDRLVRYLVKRPRNLVILQHHPRPHRLRRLTRRATPQSPGDPRTAASSPSYLTPIGPHSRCPIGAQFRRVSQLARHSENTSAASSVHEPVHADSSSAWSEGCGISLSTRAWASRSVRCPPRRGRDRSVPMGSLASATNRFCPGQGFQTCTPCGTSRMPWS